tara:strand:- start:121 stop:801 length:681 start_codon:yes stop_codon:yes gene_type:complete
MSHNAGYNLIHAKSSINGNITAIKCDANGAINTSGGADHLQAHTDIADTNTKLKVKASADGRLECMILGANDTLGNTPRHLTIDGNGRTLTIPYENPNSWRTLYLGNIKDNTNILRNVETITNDSAGGSLGGNFGAGIATSSVDMVAHKHIQFVITGSNTTNSVIIQGSHDNTNFNDVIEVYPNSIDSITYTIQHKIINGAYRYYRMRNNGTMFLYTTIQIVKLNL